MKKGKDDCFVTLTPDVMSCEHSETMSYWSDERRRKAAPAPMICDALPAPGGCVPMGCGCPTSACGYAPAGYFHMPWTCRIPVMCGCAPAYCGCGPMMSARHSMCGGEMKPPVGGMPPAGNAVPPYGGMPPAGNGMPPVATGMPPVSGEVPPYGPMPPVAGAVPPYGPMPPAGNGMPPVGNGIPPLGAMPPVGGVMPPVSSGSGYQPEPQEVLDIPLPSFNGPPATDPRQADLTKMPFSACGKLFYVMDNVKYVASANIFMNGRLMLTAAHCVQNKFTGNVGELYLFSRAYGGEISAEDLTLKAICVRKEWVEAKDSRYDYAIAVLDGESDAPSPLKYTLSQDIEGRMATSMGYPVRYFVGEQMVYVNGPVNSIPGREGVWGMLGSQMSPGSSGGAWTLDDGITAVGINSFASYSPSGEMLLSGSPRFGSEFESLYKYALTLL